MVVGHLAVGLSAKRLSRNTSLVWFITAANLVDLIWPLFLLIGLERVRIDPGNTAFTPLAFDYYPWTHSLLAGSAWGVAFAVLARTWCLATRGHARRRSRDEPLDSRPRHSPARSSAVALVGPCLRVRALALDPGDAGRGNVVVDRRNHAVSARGSPSRFSGADRVLVVRPRQHDHLGRRSVLAAATRRAQPGDAGVDRLDHRPLGMVDRTHNRAALIGHCGTRLAPRTEPRRRTPAKPSARSSHVVDHRQHPSDHDRVRRPHADDDLRGACARSCSSLDVRRGPEWPRWDRIL